MRGGKGQATLFFAVGLVLLITVAIVFLLLSRSSPTRAPEAVDIAKSRALGQYVGSCLDTIMNDELDGLGKTGGASLLDAPYGAIRIDGADTKVIYGVTRNRRQPGDLIPPATSGIGKPVLPGGSTNYYGVTLETMERYKSTTDANPDSADGLFPLPESSDGYFGQTNFPAVCAKDGPNGLGSAILCRQYLGTPPGTGGQGVALQGALTAKVESRLQQCVVLSQFRDAVGPEVTAVDPPNVTIRFTRSNVFVTLVYNLTLQGEAQVTTAPFERRYDIRYLAITEYAAALARQEGRDIRFDIQSGFRDTERVPYLEGFSVARTPMEVTNRNTGGLADFSPKADLVTITDDYSRIRGQKYQFRFLIEHRPPMLNLTVMDACVGTAWDPDDGPTSAPRLIAGKCAVVDNDGDKDENPAITR